MKLVRFISGIVLIISIIFCGSTPALAQCAMCTLNAENSIKDGNTTGNGLNSGILYLLAAPYIAVAGIGLMWYKKYQKKKPA